MRGRGGVEGGEGEGGGILKSTGHDTSLLTTSYDDQPLALGGSGGGGESGRGGGGGGRGWGGGDGRGERLEDRKSRQG